MWLAWHRRRFHGLSVGVTITGVGTSGVGDTRAVGVSVGRGTDVGNTRVGMGVGSSEPPEARGPIRPSTTLNTNSTLNVMVIIWAPRLGRCFFCLLDRPKLSSRDPGNLARNYPTHCSGRQRSVELRPVYPLAERLSDRHPSDINLSLCCAERGKHPNA